MDILDGGEASAGNVRLVLAGLNIGLLDRDETLKFFESAEAVAAVKMISTPLSGESVEIEFPTTLVCLTGAAALIAALIRTFEQGGAGPALQAKIDQIRAQVRQMPGP